MMAYNETRLKAMESSQSSMTSNRAIVSTFRKCAHQMANSLLTFLTEAYIKYLKIQQRPNLH
jgi:hypothetical protein